MVNQVARADADCDSERGQALRSSSTLLGVQETTDEIPQRGRSNHLAGRSLHGWAWSRNLERFHSGGMRRKIIGAL